MSLRIYENSYMLIFPCNLMICILSKIVIIFHLEWTNPLIKIDPKKSLSIAIFVIELSSASSILDEPILKPLVATTPISTSVITTTVTPTTETSKTFFQNYMPIVKCLVQFFIVQNYFGPGWKNLDGSKLFWTEKNIFDLTETILMGPKKI